ncbi:hypothetical protein V2J09_006269 [Rumex salicifolius]
MAGTSRILLPRQIGSELFSSGGGCDTYRCKHPYTLRISTRNHNANQSEGPSCIFIGSIETASQETLEALYIQARDAYYCGTPLIIDDMFDRVELKLRWYGSKSVVKYPRCSIRRQSAYADAQEDPSQLFALAGIWILILAFGSVALLLPVIYTATRAYQDAFDSELIFTQATRMSSLSMLNGTLFMVLGSIIGFPIASASVKALQGLWRNDLVALKGSCPSCGEEVFAFVRPNQSNSSSHRTRCHVCECSLEFRTKVEAMGSWPSVSGLSKKKATFWVHELFMQIPVMIYRGREKTRSKNEKDRLHPAQANEKPVLGNLDL